MGGSKNLDDPRTPFPVRPWKSRSGVSCDLLQDALVVVQDADGTMKLKRLDYKL